MADLKCPYCGSDKVVKQRRGFNWVVGLIGVLFAVIGALAGFIGADKIVAKCMQCGKKFDPMLG